MSGEGYLSNKSTGVIIPPPDIKTVIDRTADYVAKNGEKFEQLIMKAESSNRKFDFLKYEDDPFRPYYQKKLSESLRAQGEG